MRSTQKSIDNLSYQIIGAAIEVHKNLGPGLLESIYHKCLAIELATKDIKFASELVIPIEYKSHLLDTQLKCDFLVEEKIVVEIKSVSEILPIHQAQVINYLNLLKAPKGILINFNVVNIFHNGQKTFVNKYYDRLDNG
ncbi:GxxExxY protein [Algoriphagus sp. D3-2-R+10]|uniref:GxxExxY protein n=1 Tax=Algoriphagus aurantiacus TaxID=3103948 RepID=UPI002B3F15E5|nr:GxxExxY protein [Algoriphagus sp. D3-2-R+10]MEB2777692.1 GxxExxY protein [Algoriphagus sp. D3-2-R+10]